MKTLLTTVAADYVPDWGVGEGFREIFQNARDAEQRGSKMDINFSPRNNKILVTNLGARLEMSDFLMGTTSKRGDDEQIGNFGEGYKVGSLALIRAGKTVFIHNQMDNIIFEMTTELNQDFGKEVLAIRIHEGELEEKGENLVFEIGNITAEEWGMLRKRFLWEDFYQSIPTPYGEIITEERHLGKIYCGGIFVSEVDGIQYGYNVNPQHLKLDRDRRILDWYETKWVTSRMWGAVAEEQVERIVELLKKDSSEVEFIKYSIKKSPLEIIGETYFEGDPKIFPVIYESDRKRVEKCGKKPVTVGRIANLVFSEIYGSIEDLENESKYRNNPVLMEGEWLDNIYWATDLVKEIDKDFTQALEIKPVSFFSEDIVSFGEGTELMLSDYILKDKYQVLEAIIEHLSDITSEWPSKIWRKLYQIRDNV